ncbi:hypothetical protein Mal15_13820 [Stieleria maiorica]|uniref:DUF4332 domain-containing protein n=1 Tax=Stieleria maiorica TaxID=2795974 RepID=A0A5B9M869_9BACT|nr:DUF4332 domain-containing protein [Stieleria maiorica]QEF97342.1 hypothetical protein Mal15_13820 [Stieleria maiorica]
MLLDRIDIDTHGPLTRVELGPFSEALNVICAPEGSGKTAIVRFVRDSLIRREYPLGMMSSSAGRVVWADRNGKIHCRREHDGTSSGRRTIEFESRGEAAHRFDWLHGSWINGIADSTDATRALESIRIPESIVDGILTDTAVTSVSRVISACLRSGLGDPALFAGLPLNRSAVSGLSPAETADQQTSRRAMRDELARIETELASIELSRNGSADAPDSADLRERASIAARRRYLQSRLAQLQSAQLQSTQRNAAGWPIEGELAELHDQIWQLRVRHSELSRWLAHLQSDRNRARYTAPITASPYARHSNDDFFGVASIPPAAALEMDAELRRKLIDVDAQITRWRRVMTELSSLREMVASDANRWDLRRTFDGLGTLPMSEQVLRRGRMHHFLWALDHHAADPTVATSWGAFAADGHTTRWPDEIDLRIEAIVRQVDWLAARYDQPHSLASAWYRDLPSELTYRGSGSLVRSLRAIREDLQNVRRQGFRFAARAEYTRAEQTRAAERAIALRREHEVDDLRRSEQWVVATIERLLSYRESLVRNRQLADLVRYPSWLDDTYHRQTWSAWYINHLDGESLARSRELEQVTAQLDRCLARASQLRRRMVPPIGAAPIATGAAFTTGAALDPMLRSPDLGHLPLGDFASDPVRLQALIDATLAELRTLEQPVAPEHHVTLDGTGSPRVQWLKRRRAELIKTLGVPQAAARSGSPLADEASQWLVRLSGGRLARLDWNNADFTTAPDQVAAASQVGFAKIDGRDEAICPAVDRALAALALRMAASDLLARTGRAIPLVIELHRELVRDFVGYQHANAAPETFAPTDAAEPVNLTVLAALDDFTKNGRQAILLASDTTFADQAGRHGGQVFTIYGQRVKHEHRPLWSPHFSPEGYAGPHAQSHLPPEATDPLPHSDAFVDRYHDQYFDQLPIGASLADINRNLDTIWHEAYGISPDASPYAAPLYEMPPSAVPPSAASTAWNHGGGPPIGRMDSSPTDTGHWHDGYYFADAYTTAPSTHSTTYATTASRDSQPRSSTDGSKLQSGPTQAGQRPAASPFFLTVDSPIDQAPSIDAVAAARLRRLQVTHINHLMNQDPNRLADSLGLAGVTAATIRRWQAESRLVCHVPQLRGFDARVLVGCGIADAGHLSSIDPMDLLDRVEAFLATERGQRILLSGTSYELSRITSWIAAANVNTDDHPLGVMADRQTVNGRVVRQQRDGKTIEEKPANNRYEYEFVDDHGQVVRASSNRNRSTRRSAGRSERRGNLAGRSGGNGVGNNTGAINDDGASDFESDRRPSARRRRDDAPTRSGRNASRVARDRAPDQRRRSQRRRDSDGANRSERRRESQRADDNDLQLRFYLERESPVVDAPSIGSRMAERLEAVDIMTVDDLICADAAELAERLNRRRIDADVITAWQHQAILVCRVPMLRGHDAQLLVAADVTTPEEVAEYDPGDLLELIDPIARSNEGQRILRGGQLPDLEEITEWIRYAALSRELVAA